MMGRDYKQEILRVLERIQNPDSYRRIYNFISRLLASEHHNNQT